MFDDNGIGPSTPEGWGPEGSPAVVVILMLIALVVGTIITVLL